MSVLFLSATRLPHSGYAVNMVDVLTRIERLALLVICMMALLCRHQNEVMVVIFRTSNVGTLRASDL